MKIVLFHARVQQWRNIFRFWKSVVFMTRHAKKFLSWKLVVSNNKKKESAYKVGMTQMKSYENRKLPFWKQLSENRSQEQLASASRQRTQSRVKVFSNLCLRSKFNAHVFVEIDYFSNMHGAMLDFNSNQYFFYYREKLAIHSVVRSEVDLTSNCGDKLKKSVCFENIVHIIDEKNILIYLDFVCGVTFYSETPTKTNNPTANRKLFQDPVKIPSASQVTVRLIAPSMSSIPATSLWTLQFMAHGISSSLFT